MLGCDFVGECVELGSSVRRYKKGDILAGLIWGGKLTAVRLMPRHVDISIILGEIKGLGAYSQYTLADERISFPLSSTVSPEHASTVPLAAATAWLALFSKGSLAIDREQDKGSSVLVWGGSCKSRRTLDHQPPVILLLIIIASVGLYAIQVASMYGMKVITTCSPKHADLARSYGARHVFDYKDEEVVGKIKGVAPTLRYAFDTIGNTTSSPTASQALQDGIGNVCTVRPGKANTENVAPGAHVTDVLVWTAFLKDHAYGTFKWPVSRKTIGI